MTVLRFLLIGLSVVLPTVSALFAADAPSATTSTLPPPVSLTAEEDHQRTMQLLGIKELRPGANGRDPDAPNAANYDEAKANPYPELPDVLTLQNGEKVRSAEDWWQRRRPELVELFDREIYGRMPNSTPKVDWRVIKTEEQKLGDVPVVTKQLLGRVDNSSYPHVEVNIQVSVTTPADAKTAVPLIMELQYVFPPNADPAFVERIRATARDWQQQVLARGWGFATYVPVSVQPDNGAGLTQGIIGLINKGQPRNVDDWGALRAWGWGASRALDYFASDPMLDAKRVALAGH